MRIALFILGILLSVASASGQVDVNSTGGTTSASYSTLYDACVFINSGVHTGVITIGISANTTETTGSTINASGIGSASYTSITITPTGGGARKISGAISAGSALLSLNGADNVKINGLNSGGNSLTLSNSTVSSTSGTSTIRFYNDAKNDTIVNCSILGSSTVTGFTSGGTIFFSTAASPSGTGNDYIYISGCDIGPEGTNLPSKAIYNNGTISTGYSDSITINNCNIYDFFNASSSSYGAFIYDGAMYFNISNCRFYQTGSRTQTTGNIHACISISSNATANITGNSIGYSSSAGTGTYAFTGVTSSRFIPILISAAGLNSIYNEVQGNTIRNISFSGSSYGNGTSTPFTAIIIGSAARANIGTVTPNVIGSETSTGVLSFSTSSLSSSEVHGIYSSSTGNVNISNNTIGGFTVSNGSTGAVSFFGIRIASSTSNSHTINNNAIGGTVSNSIYNLATASTGIDCSLGNFSISSNTVRNITSNASVIGINLLASASTVHTLSQNTIHTLIATISSASASVSGIYYSGGVSVSTCTISKNFIHSMSLSGTSSSVMNGMYLTSSHPSSQITLTNNMIRLGIKAGGSSLIIPFYLYGIYLSASCNQYVFHNSVYLGGSSVTGTVSTYAFINSQTASTRVFQNNIFVNARSNSTGTGTHYATSLAGTTAGQTGLTVSNNIYYASGTGGKLGLFNSTAYTGIVEWRAATGVDALTGYGDPNFVNPAGTSSTVDLHVNNTTPAEGTGTSISSVTDDFDGNTRSSLTPVDIGADAGSFTLSDIFVPDITYIPFGASTASSSNRTISVTITDVGTGVPTSGGNRPRIWFRRSSPSVSSWVSAAGSLSSGAGNSGSWLFTIDYSILSITPAVGETYQYYFVVQDQATSPNVNYSPVSGTSHSDVQTQTSPPSIPNSYSIVSGLSTSISVGSGQTYTSLTGTGGLFAGINAGALSGNTTVTIVSDLSESGTNALNATGMDGFTLTIVPDGATARVISNSTNLSQSMIRLLGVTGITFDGRYSGTGSYLRLVNTHSTTGSSCYAVMELNNGTTANTIRNCIIETNNTNNTRGSVVIGATGTNSGNTFKANTFRAAQGTPGTAGEPAVCLYIASNSNNGSQVIGGTVASDGNDFYNYSYAAVCNVSASDHTIRYNLLHRTTATTNVTYHIRSDAGNNLNISNNSLYFDGGSCGVACFGIYLAGNANNCNISNNSIGGANSSRSGASMSITGTGAFYGMYLTLGTTSPASIQGNTISNITMSGSTFMGIYILAGSANIGTTTGNTIGGLATSADKIQNASTFYGMYILGSTFNCENNTIGNISGSGNAVWQTGIYLTVSGPVIIKNNTVRDLTASEYNSWGLINDAFGPSGMYLSMSSSSASSNIEGNLIYNISNTSTGVSSNYTQARGMSVYSANTSTTVKRNKIYNVNTAATNGTNSYAIGMVVLTSSAGLFSNNQVCAGNASGSNIEVSGIRTVGPTSTISFYNNSVYTSGSMTGSNSSYAFYRADAGTMTLRNNIFYNGRTTSGAGKMYGIYTLSASGLSSNYNLFVSGTSTAMGRVSSTDYSFSGWWVAVSGDGSSMYELTSNVSAANLFSSANTGDLNIVTSNTACWYVNGRGVQISGQTEDYGSTIAGRSTTVATGAPDIGSDEFNPSVNPPDLTVIGSHTNSGTEILTFGSRTVATITWGASGTLPSLSSYKFWSGTWPNDPTNNGGNPSAKYANAYWVINTTGGSGYTYDITLYYDDALLGTIASESNVRLAKKQTGVNGTWVNYSGSSTNTTANTVTMTGLNSFSEFTLNDNVDPLPVEWISFTGKKVYDNVELSWTTATEINNSHFEVERSTDGRNFEQIGEVKGSGNSHTPINYNYTDVTPFGNNSILYYRLKQVDFNGEYAYSKIIAVSNNKQGNGVTIEAINPNPFTEKLNLTLNNVSEGAVVIEVYDLTGRKHYTQTTLSGGQGTLSIDLSSLANLAKGVYIVNIKNGNEAIQQKLVKLK